MVYIPLFGGRLIFLVTDALRLTANVTNVSVMRDFVFPPLTQEKVYCPRSAENENDQQPHKVSNERGRFNVQKIIYH
jgi:hypothetical protein